MEMFDLKKLNELEASDKYRVEASKGFIVLEDVDAKMEINSAWKTTRENIKISAREKEKVIMN
jgi:hypothetical protein